MFDGIGDYAIVDTPCEGLTGDQYTVEFWIKTPPTNRVQALVVGDEDWSTLGSSFTIQMRPNGKIRLIHRPSGGITAGVILLSDITIDDDNWHHFACTKTPTKLRTYFDGTLHHVKTSTLNNIPSPLLLEFGRNVNTLTSSDAGAYFDGSLDDLKIWTRAKTAAEIAVDYQTENNHDAPDLFANYKFDGPTPTEDCSPNIRNVQFLNANSSGGPQLSTTVPTITDVLCTSCDVPLSGVHALILDQNKALIYWDASPGAGFFKIQYRIKGTSTWTLVNWPNQDFQRKVKIISNLLPSTTYQYRVRQQCPDLSAGPYSAIQEFTTFTSSFCGIPDDSQYAYTPVPSKMLFFFDYEPSATKYNIRWREVGSTGPLTSKVHLNAWVAIPGFTPGTDYEYRHRVLCGGLWTGYSPWKQFRTNDVAPPIAPPVAPRSDMKQLSQDAMLLYPNPAEDVLFMDFEESSIPVVIKVLNVLGKQLMEQRPTETISQIRLTDFPIGQYVVQALWEDGTQNTKLFIKN